MIAGIVGYGALLGWTSLLIWSSSYFPTDVYSDFETHMLRLALLLSIAVAYLAIRKMPPLSTRGIWIVSIIAIALAPASTLGVLFQLPFAQSIPCWVVTGLSDAIIMGLWQHYFALWNQRQTLIILGSAFVFNAVVMGLFSVLPEGARFMLPLACPLVALVAFFATRQHLQEIQQEHYEEIETPLSIRRFFINELSLSMFCNILVGFMVSLATSELFTGSTSLPLSIALFIGGLVIVVLASFVRKNLAYRFLGTLLPYAVIMLMVFAFGDEDAQLFSLCAMLALLSCFEILSIANLSRNARYLFDNRSDALIVSRSTNRFAFAAGWIIGFIVVENAALLPHGAATVAFILLAFISVVVVMRLYRIGQMSLDLMSLNDDSDENASGDLAEETMSASREAEPTSPREENRNSPYARAVAATAEEYGLSPRERQMLVYLAHGRDAKAISEKLVLSVHTVRTHIYNIYAKTGVHSHQELLDIIDLHWER